MICTYCKRRCRAEDARRGVSVLHDDAVIHLVAPGYDDWMCPTCQELARAVMREHIAEMGEIVLAALKAQQGGKT